MKVKVCGLTNRTDMHELVMTKLDYAGFIFYPKSKRFIGDNHLIDHEMTLVKKVGVFVNESIEQVKETIQKNELSVVQLHGDETPEYCTQIKQLGVEVIKVFSVDNAFDFKLTDSYSQIANYFLFDTKSEHYGGSGKQFDWDKINQYHGDTSFFLSGGIGPDDVNSIKKIKHSQLYGIDINSCFEISPGEKDVFKVKTFIEQLRT